MDPLALQRIPARMTTDAGWTPPTLTLLCASTAGVVAQGGFYLPGRILVAVLALTASVLAVRSGAPAALKEDRWLIGSAAAVALWAVFRAATAGGAAVAAGICLSLATLLAGVVAARRARPVDLATGLVGIGVLVAVTGWAGVAWRIERWSVLVEATLWRASSTLTYPNAAAAILAVAALLAFALLLAEPGSVWRACAFYLLLTGLAATLSRAGALAFAAGVLVFAFFAAVRAVLRHLAPALLGAAVALAGLVPSFPATSAPRPLLAGGGLLLGGLIAVLPAKLRGGKLAVAWGLLLAAAAGALAPLATRPRSAQLDTLLHRRFTVASQGRTGALRSALDQIAAHPLLGSGPGRARYFWFDFEGQLVVSRWVHNEYLQWLVDLGAIGLIPLAALGAAVVVALRRGRAAGAPQPLWAGVVATVAALAVHSAFDFLWQLSVVPLVFGVLVGMAGPHHSEGRTPSPNGEERQ
ncbi:O-antigen ligase family protein [Dactylosporangium roseum]|uniref:O-antigen ligase family protein n=1 Tax=Dactylosporangium roseum TaxID=47989 RepID=A0ABY5YYQ4_9ACTN|nr:O-antigen ligase family protein [Dactylosporangium roseum]UWZ34880.1 O-antigen ligase family protein [Dactylosporangium roseum]